MISVLLPTIRPHLWHRAFASIVPAAGSVPFEVVVVADFQRPFFGDDVHCWWQWWERPRNGVVDAVNVAYDAARGDYLFLFNDESTLDPGALELLYHAAEAEPWTIWSPKHLPPFPFVYYGKPFVPFPFAHRDVFKKLGGMLDPVYRGFYADPDLSLRAHAQGVPLRIVEGAVLRHCNDHDYAHQQMVGAYLAADREVFRRRWDYLGEFRDP